MLIILVEEKTSWFQYIWEQFVRMQGLTTSCQIRTLAEMPASAAGGKDMPIIEYGSQRRYANSLFIPKCTKYRTDDYNWLRADLPVFSGTIVGGTDKISYDLFFNAFVHLSRLEEWEAEQKGTFIWSYAFRHPRKDQRIWDIPVVNVLFNELESMIKTRYPVAEFAAPSMPFIELSHDVDYIEKTTPLRLKRTAFETYNSFKCLAHGRIREGVDRMKKGALFALRRCGYWCFDYWEDLEKKHATRSVFYVYAKSAVKDPKTWLLDPSYDIRTNTKLQQQFKHLVSEGFEVGLHGSFKSAEDGRLLKREKEILESALGLPITKTRQHWLRYVEGRTPYLHDELFSQDSTLGWNDRLGFRSGCASRYNPYDHKNQKSFRFAEIPQVVMDSVIYEYHLDDSEVASVKAITLIELLRNCKNARISLSWHQRTCSADYGWHKTYERMLKIV